MKKFFLIMILCLYSLGYSQGENDNWYFGHLAAVNFSGVNPQVIAGSQMYSYHATATVSDQNGDLLFYTDGWQVWNRSHQIMSNGNLAQPARQMVIVKHPTNANLYYIISGGVSVNGFTNETARYTVVDMSLGSNGSNGLPLGDVVSSQTNISILNELGNVFTNARGVTVVPHGNANSFWILILTEAKLYAYHLNNQGFINTPIVSNLNTSGNIVFPQLNFIKASPQVNTCSNFTNFLSMSSVSGYNNVNESLVCSFNNFSGLVTSDYNLSIASLEPLYFEFNKYSNILYAGRYGLGSTNSMLYAVDLSNSTNSNVIYNPISTLQPVINGSPGIGALERNTKGDIYFYLPSYNNGIYLGKIINPDVYGQSSADIANFNFTTMGGLGGGSLNNLPQLVPQLSTSTNYFCIAAINLNSTETNNNFTYKASQTITTELNYNISSGKNIIMKAGNSITLLPNTHIEFGATYLAKIENCNCVEGKGKNEVLQDKMFLDLRTMASTDLKKDIKKVFIYPNPTSDILNIKTDSKITAVSVVDLTGRKISVKLEGNQIDVREIPAGNYIINIETEDGISNEKFIKK